MKYGEKEILEFDINLDEHYWQNEHKKDYTIDIEFARVYVQMSQIRLP